MRSVPLTGTAVSGVPSADATASDRRGGRADRERRGGVKHGVHNRIRRL